MGACCEPKALASNEMVDLPAPALDKNDKVVAWEQSQPFARCTFSAYFTQLTKALEASDCQPDVSFLALRANFKTPAWATLRNDESDFCKYLRRVAGKTEETLDFNHMVSLGLLYCQDQRKPDSKAKALYSLL